MIDNMHSLPAYHFDPVITALKQRIIELEKELETLRPHVNVHTEKLEYKAQWNNKIIRTVEEGLKDPQSFYARNHYEKDVERYKQENHEIKLELFRRGINYDYDTWKGFFDWQINYYKKENKWLDKCIKFREDDIKDLKKYSLGLKQIEIKEKYECGKWIKDITPETTGYTYEWGCTPEKWVRITVYVFGRIFKRYLVNDYDEGHMITKILGEWKND